MHKGPLYELYQAYRPFCGEYSYPQWAPAQWKITTAIWSGSQAASVPATPLYLTAVGITPSLRARYECPLFDTGGGVWATLIWEAYLASNIICLGLLGGDWGPHGSLPVAPTYGTLSPWDALSRGFGNTGTSAEAYLHPDALIWEPRSY